MMNFLDFLKKTFSTKFHAATLIIKIVIVMQMINDLNNDTYFCFEYNFLYSLLILSLLNFFIPNIYLSKMNRIENQLINYVMSCI